MSDPIRPTIPGVDVNPDFGYDVNASSLADYNDEQISLLPGAESMANSIEYDEAKAKENGAVFAENGLVWNPSQTNVIGRWNVQEYMHDQLAKGKSFDEAKATLKGGIVYDSVGGELVSRNKDAPQTPGSSFAGGPKSPSNSGSTAGASKAPPTTGTSSKTPPTTGTSSNNGSPNGSSFPGVGSLPLPSGVPSVGGGGGAAEAGPQVGNITDPGAGAAVGGFNAAPSSLYDFLPPNFNQLGPEERLSAIIGAVTRRQEQGLGAQLGRIDASQTERLDRAQGTRALEDKILGDTDVMSEGDIQRIAGKQTQRGNQQANVLADALQNRRANAGSARSGSAQTERSAILTGAANAAAQSEADIRAGARQANFNSRNSALGAVGASSRADVGLGAGIGQAGAGAIGDAQVFGDAFLTQNLLGNGPAQSPLVNRAHPEFNPAGHAL